MRWAASWRGARGDAFRGWVQGARQTHSGGEGGGGGEVEVGVDRSGLLGGSRWVSAAYGADPYEPATPRADAREASLLMRHLVGEVRRRAGPMPVAEYVRTCLTHPEHGYYMRRDVFGRRGDFVTGPEVSQVFGELVGVWAVVAWERMGRPSRVRLCELGPGRGTLMADVLRVAKQMPDFGKAVAGVDFVEVSPHLRGMQAAKLGCAKVNGEDTARVAGREVPVAWHGAVGDVPSGGGEPLLVLAHEFFDALPVNLFKRRPVLVHAASGEDVLGPWGEVLVDARQDEGVQGGLKLVPVTSREETANCASQLRPRLSRLPSAVSRQQLREVEVCPEGRLVAAEVASRIARHGGAALWMDYGYEAPRGKFSLAGIRDHVFVDPFDDPGGADLSAHVDFSELADAVLAEVSGEDSPQALDLQPGREGRWGGEKKVHEVEVHGSVTQRDFLLAMGAPARFEALAKRAKTDAERVDLQLAFERLTGGSDSGAGGKGVSRNQEGMGLSYRFLAVCSAPAQPLLPGEDTFHGIFGGKVRTSA